MPDQAKNMLIGIFVVAACAVIIFLLMFLHPSVGDEGRFLRVRFADIDKISVGTRVNFAGKPVGEVIEIRELPDVDVERKSINGYVYVYELTLRVDTGVNVFNTDEVASRTSGLLGEKSVSITPGVPKSGEALYLINDEIIYASETGSVEDTLKELRNLAGKIETTIDGVNEVLDTMHKNKFWDNLGDTAANVKDITKALNDPEKLNHILANLDEFTHDLKNNFKSAWPKIDKVIDNFSATSNNTMSITEKIYKGEGSIGKIIVNDDLYLRFTSLLSKADTTLNDINHYGILFHTDKHWQRLRARKMNLMQKLSTPQEFRNYFNDELDQVNTSLARVAMVLGQYEMQPPYCCCNLLANPEYSKVFAELMRKISGLEEEVRLYNEQVVDQAAKETEFVDCYGCYE